jgi:predicted enzyme related to lactoylglutathione lyase
VNVFVSDQDGAKEFSIGKLGFEEQMDAPMGPDSRWVQIAPKGAQTSLVLFKPTKDMPNYDLAVSQIGGFTNFIFGVDDIQATHRELTAKGVGFQDEPSQQPWGWWATIKDPDGNVSGLHQ